MADGGLTFSAATSGYEDDPQAHLLNLICVQVFQRLHAARKGLHNYVFEIGSGTGGTSSFVLPALNPHTTKYVFSDLSQAFLSNARVRFAQFPFVEYVIFNGDIHPANQGFHSHEIHQVLATNVIHATIHLASTMAGINVLLAPGGHIVFNEVHNGGTLIEDLTYGLTDGWWVFTDIERRATYPLMQTPKWNALFNACGFTPVWHTPDEGVYLTNQSVLVARSGGGAVRTYRETPPCSELDPTASYLITGAVGGLGLISALIMLERGAKHMHFVSRRDRVPEEAKELFARIAGSSCTVHRERCNVSSASQVSKLFLERPDMPPCQGVIHGAGVLSDGMVLKQSRKKYEDVFGPKNFGAWNLHCASAHRPQSLKFNIMFSSAAGFSGSPGQSNHSAANAGIDGLIAMRAALGLAGASVSWGAVAEVGYAARHSVAMDNMSVRFDHAWLALEALQVKPFSHVCADPTLHMRGQGQPPLRLATFKGSFDRFRMAGAKRAPKRDLLKEAPATQGDALDAAAQQEVADGAADAGQAGAEDAAASDADAQRRHNLLDAMEELHRTWHEPAAVTRASSFGAAAAPALEVY